jgi:hypothetical protein
VRLHTVPEVGLARAANQRVVDDSATSLLNTSSTLLIEQLFEPKLVLSALSFDFSTIAYWLATSLLSITAFAHRIDFLAYF